MCKDFSNIQHIAILCAVLIIRHLARGPSNLSWTYTLLSKNLSWANMYFIPSRLPVCSTINVVLFCIYLLDTHLHWGLLFTTMLFWLYVNLSDASGRNFQLLFMYQIYIWRTVQEIVLAFDPHINKSPFVLTLTRLTNCQRSQRDDHSIRTGVSLSRKSPRATWAREQKNLRAQPCIYEPNIMCKSSIGQLNLQYPFHFGENRYSECSQHSFYIGVHTGIKILS